MTDIINGILDVVAGAGEWVVKVLPTSPFTAVQNRLDSDILGYINYFLPINEALSIGTAWLIAIGGHYLYSIILRWMKVIQ